MQIQQISPLDFPYVKEEDVGSEKIVKMIKKEEDFSTGKEGYTPTRFPVFPMGFNPYIQPRTMPWFPPTMGFPFLPMMSPMYGMHPLYARNFNKIQGEKQINESVLKKPVRHCKEKAPTKPKKVCRPPPSLLKPEPELHEKIYVKTEEMHNEVKKFIRVQRKSKRSVRVSACKNYIGLLCAGFSRAVLLEKNNAILNYTRELIAKRKMILAPSPAITVEKLLEEFKIYIQQNICGKRVKKYNRERDFKVRNSDELDNLLLPKVTDSDLVCARKEVLREMINFFFNSECYGEWLSKGMMSEGNRVFFLRNKKEIHRKFLNPAFYKPRFNHNQDEAIVV